MTQALQNEPGWPVEASTGGRNRRVVFLLDASSAVEDRVLRAWIERHRPESMHASDVVVIPIPPSRKRPRQLPPRAPLETAVASTDDPLFAPLRIAWRPREVEGRRTARLRDLVLGDPRDPGPLYQRSVLRRDPERCVIVAGEPAPLSELRARWQRDAGTRLAQTTGLADFVLRQAVLALERAERRMRGARYKVPRFVHEDVLGRPSFRARLAQLARETGRDEADLPREASLDLREIAATHSPFVIDLVARLIHLLYTQGYGESIHYDPAQIEQVAAIAQRHPVVFLPTHKSNLDHLVLQYMLHENGLPPNHTAGGINMNFFPVGPLVRRSGTFFIRRSFKDDPVYKLVLHEYVAYLIEKRFPLEWYLEGGRSRSGKLLPPRYGLLAYVVDAFRAGRSEDVYLLPVSIAYDQITDVGDYVAEQRGAKKETESFSWFVHVIRRLRRSYGDIHIRFGEPLSLAKWMGTTDADALSRDPSASGEDDVGLAVQKLAFEVSVRINRATPITPTSLVTLALLGSGDTALTLDETVGALRNLVDYVRRRALPTTAELDLDTPEGVKRALDVLVESEVVSCYSEGPEAVYAIHEGQHLTAAYYRNTIIHFFVNGAIAELALLRAAEDDVRDAAATFWDEAMRLRDLLKFEFFFAEKEAFRNELRAELSLHDAEWERRLSAGPSAIHDVIESIRPFSAHRILRPFLESYRVVADTLQRLEPGAKTETSALLAACIARAKQYRLQRRLHSDESVSKVLFETGLRLAKNRGLVGSGDGDLARARAAFAEEVRECIRRVDGIEALAAKRRAGLID